MPELPSLENLATFIDSIKNVAFALMFVLAGFYVTVTPGVVTEYAGQWVGAAMTVAGFYIGARSEKGKTQGIVAQIKAEEKLNDAK
jgi:hypothetical protein